MSVRDYTYDLHFENSVSYIDHAPYPPPLAAPEELLAAARQVEDARETAYTRVEEAEAARDAIRQAEADDERLTLQAARNGTAHVPLKPGAEALAKDARRQSDHAISAAQNAFYRYATTYQEILADEQRRTAWLTRLMPGYEDALAEVRAAHQHVMDCAERTLTLRRLVHVLATEPASVNAQSVGGLRTWMDSTIVDKELGWVINEPDWMPTARALLADTTTDHDEEAAA